MCRGPSKAVCDRGGLMGLVCGHTIFVLGVIMTKGENWRLATMLLWKLLLHKICPLFFYYDINCRFKRWFLAWLKQASAMKLSPEARAAAALMFMPLPPFHAYMHNAECRHEHGLLNLEFPTFGQPCGENTEIYWSSMNQLARLKFATWLYANIFLENIIADINLRHDQRLAPFIVARCRRLSSKIAANEEELSLLQEALSGDAQVRSRVSVFVISCPLVQPHWCCEPHLHV